MAAAPKKISIKPEKNEFDDHFLDVVGNAFKFDHAKGLAEWLKNSADAYSTTAKVRDAEQFVLLRFRQGKPKKNSVFECIDFVGMTKKDIDKALKRWGDPKAAKKGTNIATFGGHGNGGKFYMRQMFETSRYVTYRGGLLNVFGFDERKRYGFAQGLIDRPMSLQDALAFAELDGLNIPKVVRERWKSRSKEAGFTAVIGEHPERFKGRATVATILENLRVHPQARRLVGHKQVHVLPYGNKWGDRLLGPEITPREGYESQREILLPRKLERDGDVFELRNSKHPQGKLILRTSQQPLTRAGELAALNAIDILGEVGCIGSYRMHELGPMRFAQEAEFIYGECVCPILEDQQLNCVLNDREKLADNELTRALLGWIREQVDALAEEMAEKRRKEQKSRDLRQSSLFNQLLDKWKNKFIPKLTSELFGGSGIGDSFGGSGGGGEDPMAEGKGTGKDGKRDKGEGEGGGGAGDERRKGPAFPKVLLSGFNTDPLDPNATAAFQCDPRHPPVYQRDIDINHSIYWINTSRPLAERIIDQYGSNGARWREYLFQRYVDIIAKQAIHALGRRDPDLTADKIDGLLDDVLSRVHDAAATDLEAFLFEESLTGSAPSAPALSADVDPSAGEGDGSPTGEGDRAVARSRKPRARTLR
jgi:hypothetical protein